MSKPNLNPKPKVFIALDIPNKEEALRVASKWSPVISGLKVGPNLGFQLAPSDWQSLANQGEVFIDYKFYDIPSVVEKSVIRAFECGASFCTVHAMNGPECLERLKKLEVELNKQRFFKILAVTLLTSFDQDKNPLPLTDKKPAPAVVSDLAHVVFESGLTGLVSSAFEVELVKSQNEEAYLVTPGIRFSEDAVGDQKRVATPKEAWLMGSDYLVMGRSLLSATTDETKFKSVTEQLRDEWQSVQ